MLYDTFSTLGSASISSRKHYRKLAHAKPDHPPAVVPALELPERAALAQHLTDMEGGGNFLIFTASGWPPAPDNRRNAACHLKVSKDLDSEAVQAV